MILSSRRRAVRLLPTSPPLYFAVALLAMVGTLLLSQVENMAAGVVPEFALTTASGSWYTYSLASYTQSSPTQYTVNDSVVTATLTDLGGGLWSLRINQAKQDIRTVFFPWQQQRTPLDSDITNDIYYYPNLLGRTEKAQSRNVDWTWYGSLYPGWIAAPVEVMADPNSAKIVAATNWPPKSVTPMYAAQRMVLRYDSPIATGNSETFGALIATVTGDASTGDVPWQKALDLYKQWLDRNMGPVSYPSWMWDGQGMLNLQLQAYLDTNAVDRSWQQTDKALYPWVLMWGQMSPLPNGSCCGVDPSTGQYYPTLPAMDGRFATSGLPAWTQKVVAAGYHAGYYSAPYSSRYSTGPNGYLTTSSGLDWFTNYNNTNGNYGANSYYFDTFARENWGDPDAILKLFDTGILPKAALSEGIVDVYPLPGLVSGSLAGGEYCGAPHKRPEDYVVTSFPPFVRYLLNDRLIYWGQSNDDYQFWGVQTHSGCDYATYCATGLCDYGIEHQILLTGARIEMRPNTNNAVIDSIISERQRTNWWARRPRYLATRGLNLSSIPLTSQVQVAHFQDGGGADLVAISNPRLVSGLTFTLNGQTITVPAQHIAIIDATLGRTVPSAPTGLRITQ